MHGQYQLSSTNVELGEGGEGTVKRAINIQTNEQVAIKIISKAQADVGDNHHIREIQILHIISHPNIISVIESIESDIFVYIIMELGTNDLMHKLEQNIYGEDLAKAVSKDLFCALDYLHKAGICHRDIKPENLICCKYDNKESWKLADFGIAAFFTEQSPSITGNIGTFEYMAPELILNQNYTKAVDCWAAGVTIFSVIVFEIPWNTPDKDQRELMITTGTVEWSDAWNDVSNFSKNFVSKLLQYKYLIE